MWSECHSNARCKHTHTHARSRARARAGSKQVQVRLVHSAITQSRTKAILDAQGVDAICAFIGKEKVHDFAMVFFRCKVQRGVFAPVLNAHLRFVSD